MDANQWIESGQTAYFPKSSNVVSASFQRRRGLFRRLKRLFGSEVSGTLVVTFIRSGTYTTKENPISESLAKAFFNSSSKGKFVHVHLKDILKKDR